MKAVAFSPGHISGFFEPVYDKQDLSKTGSRGAGINLTLGAISEVSLFDAKKQIFEIFINNKKINSPIIELSLRYLIGDRPCKVVVNTELQLPPGQGFGMSSASALSSTYALSKIIGIQKTDAIKASHFAEIQLKTGLGDVMASSFGGVEIRKEAGLPPWGIIEHIPGKFDLVLGVIGKELDTKKILSDPKKVDNISIYGKFCCKKLLEKPSIENFFTLSKYFTEKTNLVEKNVLKAINTVNKFGMASMCMLGNSIFAAGDLEKLCSVLTPMASVYICSVDECGARVIEI